MLFLLGCMVRISTIVCIKNRNNNNENIQA